jgi:ribosomal protein L40E
MTKLCSLCNAENRDEAQFCRACGSAFAASVQAASFGNEPSADNICSECGFRNKPGIRYCANCGMSLASTSEDAPPGDLAPTAPFDPYASLSPPPISYESFAPVAPYPPAPTATSAYAPALDDTAPLDLADAGATLAIRTQEAHEATPEFMQAERAAPPIRAKLMVGIVVAVLALSAAWLFLRNTSPPPATIAAPAPVSAAPPVAAPAAPVVEAPAVVTAPAPAPASAIEIEAAPAAAPVVPAAPATIDTPPPAAAAPLPQVTDAAPVESGDAEAKRVAAEKQRRDKAERDAKAKAVADQQAASAAAHAEPDAQARKRAEDAQRARPASSTPAHASGASTGPRGVRESCAGRGTIAEAVCQSRLCGAVEHANEPICRQLREADERHRTLVN